MQRVGACGKNKMIFWGRMESDKARGSDGRILPANEAKDACKHWAVQRSAFECRACRGVCCRVEEAFSRRQKMGRIVPKCVVQVVER